MQWTLQRKSLNLRCRILCVKLSSQYSQNSKDPNSAIKFKVTFPLLSLPNVVIHHLAGYLDPESTLFLGATCLSLGKIISKRLLARDAAILSNIIAGLETLTKNLVQVDIK